jgi:pyruvate,water dikinase
MVTATWGLGEAIVGGLVTPDTLTVEKTTGRILSRETADKQVMTVRVESGTEEQPVPEAKRRAAVLNDQQAAELVRLGVQIEQLYGLPMDIEWARADGKFAILQARPITALPEPEAPVPTKWPLPGKGPFMRGSIVDFMPDPLSPLFSTLGRSRYNASFQRLVEWFARDRKTRMFSLVTINGYGYMSVDIDLRSGLKIAAVMTRLPQLVRLAVPRWRDEAVPRYAATVARWQARRLPDVPASELLTGAYEILDVAMDHLTTLQGGIMGIAGSAEATFSGVYDKLIRREDDPEAAAFVLGYDSTPILADKALYDLAGWCRDQLGLVEYIQSTPAEQLAANLVSPQAPPGLDVPVWRELQTRWQAHLEQYGAMIYSLDFARPLPIDEPTPLLETLKLYLSGQAPNPYERQQKLAERREAAMQFTLARLKGLRLKLFRMVLGWAQAVAPLREDGIAYLGYGYPQLRRILKELGRRLVQAGAVHQPDDIFWLIESEVRAAVAALDQGQAIAPLMDAVKQRRAEWQAQKRLTPPPTLPPMKKFLGISTEQWLPASGEDQAGDMLKGVAASPGKITAPACVLHGPEDFDQMRPGNVLVAGITTPAWTPLFAMAAAVVTDIGGPLSHGSIVAREYGIPAVMGTGVATKRIQSGQEITVDGSAGTVTLSKSVR